MSLQRISKLLVVMLSVVLLSGCNWVQRMTNLSGTVEAPSPSPVTQQVYAEKLSVALVHNEDAQTIDIVASPNGDSIPVTSFSVLVVFNGTDMEAGDLIPGQDLATAGWTFPFAGLAENADGTYSAKLAGIIIGDGSFSPGQVLASVPLSPTTDVSQIEAMIDQEDTKFYTRSMEQILLNAYGRTDIK